MRDLVSTLVLLAAASVTAATTAAAQVPNAAYADAFEVRRARRDPIVSYAVRVDTTDLVRYEVTMTVRQAPAVTRLAFPRWAPGAYRIAEFGGYAQGVTVTRDGKPVQLSIGTDGTWLLAPEPAGGTLIARWHVTFPTPAAAASPNNRNFLTARGGLFDGPLTFAFLPGYERLPAHVRFDVPASWQVVTGLAPTADPRTFFASSYDVLIDAPALAGPPDALHVWRFRVDDVPHRIAYWAQPDAPAFDSLRFVWVADSIVRAARDIMGELPYREYSFLFIDGAGGGLEHLNSTTIGARAARLARDPADAASVTAHEFFHTWNVKRLRPRELGPFDYLRVVRTPNLWWSEGVTDYFAEEILRRAGLQDSAAAVRGLASSIESWLDNPGATRVAPEQSSRTAWDPPAANQGYSISYYLQGALLGELLELRLRDQTNGRRGMDDVMRALYDRFAGPTGFVAADVERAVNAACDCDLSPVFAAHVRGAQPIDWDQWLGRAGWRLDTVRVTAVDSADRPLADLRASVGTFAGIGSAGGAAGSRPRLAIPGPHTAWYRAGLRGGDEVVSVRGRPVHSPDHWRAALAGVQPTDSVTVEVLRAGAPVRATVVPGSYQMLRVRLVDLPTVSERQRRLRAVWLRGPAAAN
ncbi:MAG: M61 family metallopeptidase [Gemmatirosa sp.]